MARARGSQIYSPDIVEELKTAMAIESRPGEDDEASFRQKMNALQRFLNHGISRFSIDSWHHALTALYHAYHPHLHHHHHQDHDSHKPVVTKLSGLEDLRVLSRDVMLQREGGSLREADAQALKYLENFLVALHCVREAKGCVSDLHRFLYRYYYDPDEGREHSHVRSGKAMSRASTMHAGPDGQSHGPSSYEVSAKQFGILTLQQMSGSTGHKLRRTVADMRQILQRWDRLMTGEGEIRPEDLDAESQEDLQMLSGTAAFEPVLRLLPDIFTKFYKCLELLKQWWVLAHEIYPELPINRPPTPSSTRASREGTLSRVEDSDSELSAVTEASLDRSCDDVTVPISEQLQRVEESIQGKEDVLQSLNDELKLLDERERHFESLVEAYEKVTAELEEQTRQRKELVTIREKETFPPHNQISGTEILQTSKPHHDSADDLNEQVARVEREMQMLQFQQTLLRQDYMVQLEVRPSLIRFVDDLRIKIAEAQNSLVEDKMERIKLRDLAEGGETSTTSAKSASPSNKYPNHGRKDTPPQSSTTSVRSVSPSDPDPPSHDREDTPPPKSNANANKAAERKMELSRLLTKPMREYTSGSSVAGETAALPAVAERKRRQSHPAAARREETDKRPAAAPTIKIHRASMDKSAASADNQSPKKSPRGPAVNVKSSQPHRKTLVPETQNRTESLFQRRLGKTQGNDTSAEKTGEQHRRNQLDLPVQRPRAKSDPHTLKTDAKSLKLKSEQEEKVSPKVRDNKSSPRSPTNSDKSSQDSHTKKPVAHGKTSKTTSSDNVGKSAVTSSHRSKSDDMKTSKADDTKNAKEATKHTSATSHTSKASESKKHSDVTSSKSSDNDKKDSDKSLPKSVPRHADKNPRGAQPDPKEKDDDRKRHAASVKPTEKNKTTSPKPTQDDVRKGSNGTTTSQLLKQDDKKASRTAAPERQKHSSSEEGKGNVKCNGKPDDVKEVGKMASQKPNPTGRPNRVVARK